MAVEKFTINVSDTVLADLRHRLAATRWPDEIEHSGWDLGSSLSYMKSLAGPKSASGKLRLQAGKLRLQDCGRVTGDTEVKKTSP